MKRIWADGKLLRGAAGDWKSQTGFRLYAGGEDQAADPLIASAEGLALTPAYRGLAYAVFEDFQLADYGNRIPSLTFEVEADAAAVPVGAIAAELSRRWSGGRRDPGRACGLCRERGQRRRAMQGIAEAVPLVIADDGVALSVRDGMEEPVPLGEGAGGEDRPRIERRAAGTLPDEIALTYYEPARDYQSGLQRARGAAGRGGAWRRWSWPQRCPPPDAKALAEARLARDWAGRTTAEVVLPWRGLALSPGRAVTLPGRGERWRIAADYGQGMKLRLSLVATAPPTGLTPEAKRRAAGRRSRSGAGAEPHRALRAAGAGGACWRRRAFMSRRQAYRRAGGGPA